MGSFTTPDVFSGPDGIAVDQNGRLFVVDSSEAGVFELTSSGSLVSSFSVMTTSTFPEGIDVTPNGNLLISDQNTDTISEYTPSGMLDGQEDISGATTFSNGVVIARDGQFYLTDDLDDAAAGSVVLVDAVAGTLQSLDLSTLVGFSEPEGIEYVSQTGTLLVVDDATAELVELTQSGELLARYDLAAITGFSDPEGLALDETSDILYVAFDSDGAVATFSFESAIPEPATAATSFICLLGIAAWRGLIRAYRG